MDKILGLVVALAILCLTGGCGTPPAPDARVEIEGERPNVILVTFCTMRADRFGAYGESDLTPSIDALTHEGVVFRNHYTQAAFSGASFASIITGKYPFGHGVYDHPRKLGDEHVTLAELLEDAGYATGAFLTHGYLRPKWNYLQGFDVYNGVEMDKVVNVKGAKGHVVGAARRVKEALNWVSGLGDRPYFIWYQTRLTHYFPKGKIPYVSKEDLRIAKAFQRQTSGLTSSDVMFSFDELGVSSETEKGLLANYDAAVARTDYLLGQLIAGLEQMDRFANTIVVITADHGETLGEQGLIFNHDSNLFEPTIRVPLVLRIPGSKSREVDAITRNIDLLPTLGALVGLEVPMDLHGENLVPLIEGEALDLPAFSETRPRVEGRDKFERYRLLVPGVEGKIRTIRQGQYKLILYPTLDGYELELYDLESDPAESTNLADEMPDVAKGLAWRLEEWFSNYDEADVAPLDLDEEDLESLRALGYID